MAVAQRYAATQSMDRGGPSGLADVLEVLLDKGLVIDAFVRVSLVGIELLTVDVRVVVASVDTYLRFAEATNRLDLQQATNSQTLGDLLSGDGGRRHAAERGERSGGELGNGTGNHRDGARERDQEERPAKESSDSPDSRDDRGILGRILERGHAFEEK